MILIAIMRKIKIIFALIIWIVVIICYSSYSQGTISDNKNMEFDTSTVKKPLIGIQIAILYPSIFNIGSLSENNSIIIAVPTQYYTPGFFIKYKQHTFNAGPIFRPPVYNRNKISIEGGFGNLLKYKLGGLYVQYSYQILNKKFYYNDFSAGLFQYSYKTVHNPRMNRKNMLNSYGLTFSNISSFNIYRFIIVYLEPSMAIYFFDYTAIYNDMIIDQKTGREVNLQFKLGFNFIINRIKSYEQ